jgi:hypothetical protein
MMVNGNEEGSIEYWKHASKMCPQNPYLWYRMGATYVAIYNKKLQSNYKNNSNNLNDEYLIKVKESKMSKKRSKSNKNNDK